MTELSTSYNPEDNALTVSSSKEAIDADNVYDFDMSSVDDIFASDEEVAQLKKEGLLDQQEYVQESGQSGDAEWMYHRVVKFKDSDRFEWEVPLTKAQQEAGMRSKEVNPNKHHFVAVRGIPLTFQYTMSWTKQTQDGKYYSFCRASKLVEDLGDKVRTTKGSHPLKSPVRMMHQDKNNPTELNYFWKNNTHLELFATRTLDKDNKVYEERSCLECVRRGEHFEGNDIGAPNVQKCRPDGELLFVVYELGLKDATAHIEDDLNQPVTVNWVSVKDAGITGFDGQPLDRPFVVRIKGLGTSQMASIGDGKYDLPVILPSHQKAYDPKTCFLPDDNVLSAQDFYKYLNGKNSEGRRETAKNGLSLYPVMTEIYMTELKEKTATKDFIPVFRPIAVGKDTEYNGLSLASYVGTALMIAKHEEAIAKGSGSLFESPTLPPANNSVLPATVNTAVLSSNGKSKPKTQQSVTESIGKKNMLTFTPPQAK